MTLFDKHIAALTTATKKAKDKTKLKEKIKKIKQMKSWNNFLSQ